MPTLDEQEQAALQAMPGVKLPDAPVDPASPGPETVPDTDQDEIIKAALESYKTFDEHTRAKILQQPISRFKKASRIDSLTEAAHVLLAELDTQQRDRVLEISQENSWPPWVVVLGAVARAADLQELLSGDMKPDWLSAPEQREHAGLAAVKCVRCGGVIPNARRGQTACCNRHGSGQDAHSEDCPLGHLVLVQGTWFDTRAGRP